MTERDSTEDYMADDRERMSAYAIRFLGSWLTEMDGTLARWRESYLPRDFPFDFSLDSLDALEPLLLARYPDRASVTSDETAEFTEGAVRYIGETWRRHVPSRWVYHDSGAADTNIFNRVPLIASNVPDEHEEAIVPLHTLVAFAVEREPEILREMLSVLIDSIEEAEEGE
ncbi:hypothetical protein ACIRQP_16435 [Streptomyces sp. NPDC102274]|uniref:hypothetical protein n=1 Tax=Streptomyces sp. NPDC102274 TaxID=3366151 RepID=UPI00382807DD